MGLRHLFISEPDAGYFMENRLAEIRKQKKIGQGYLVEKLGVSRQTISSIENGRCTPSLELALDISYLLGIPVEEIFIYENRFIQADHALQ